MIESPISSLLTASLFLFTVGLPIFIIHRLWIVYTSKKNQITANTTIPEVTTIAKAINDPSIVQEHEHGTDIEVGSHTLVAATKFIPKDSRKSALSATRPNAGEDAFFTYVAKSKASKFIGALGIADGVGGYAELGVDAGLMAWQLMENARDYFIKSCENHALYQTPREILHRAFETIMFDNQVECGGTTACLISIFKNENEELFLNYANLGDSGFMVVRDGDVIFRTEDQTHYFNAPYQLAIPPKNRTVLMNEPREADQFSVGKHLSVKEGDYIILATDGLWDNIFDEDVVDILMSNAKNHTSHHSIVTSTCEEILARTCSVSTNKPKPVMTPFQRYAHDNKRNWVGGKIDDISITVGCVSIVK